jgi:hypothetical protein
VRRAGATGLEPATSGVTGRRSSEPVSRKSLYHGDFRYPEWPLERSDRDVGPLFYRLDPRGNVRVCSAEQRRERVSHPGLFSVVRPCSGPGAERTRDLWCRGLVPLRRPRRGTSPPLAEDQQKRTGANRRERDRTEPRTLVSIRSQRAPPCRIHAVWVSHKPVVYARAACCAKNRSRRASPRRPHRLLRPHARPLPA